MDPEKFLVAALGEDGAWQTPVRVRCQRCNGYSPPVGGTGNLRDGELPGEARLSALQDWAEQHECGPALAPDAWLRAAEEAQAQLKALGHDMDLNACSKAFAGALQAVWDDVKQAAAR